MSIETALLAIKTANTPLNSLIGGRFYSDAFPQGAVLPMACFFVVSRPRMDYTFATRPQLSAVRVQVDGYAATAALRAALRTALIDCFMPETRINGTYGGEFIFDIRIDNEGQEVEQLDTGREAYRIRIDLIVNMRES